MMNRLTERFSNGQAASYWCGSNCKYDHKYCRENLENCPAMEDILEKLAHYEDLEEAKRLVELPCKVGDTVWELCKCDDDKYRIFPMTVCRIVTFGLPRLLKDNEIEVWNIYAESDYCKMYKSFYDIGKTVFFTHEEAEVVLKECESE